MRVSNPFGGHKHMSKISFVHHSMGEEEERAVEGLMLLWRRLNAEMQRMQASPAARLLDDVLQAMDPASGLTLQDRQQVLPICCQQQLSMFGVASHGETGCRILSLWCYHTAFTLL